MITLERAIEITGLSLSEIGEMVGMSKSTISRVKTHDYPGWEKLEKEAVEMMVKRGKLAVEQSGLLEQPVIAMGKLVIDSTRFITTENVMDVDDLGADLLNPMTTLNASIGMVVGSAGYGKTTTIQHFCTGNPMAVYVLFIEGFTLTALMREVAKALTGNKAGSFEKNLELIKDATSIYRKLLVIDEADRLPVKFLESLRNINEYCHMPIMLVGEKMLLSKMQSLPRLESRIRRPLITFRPLSSLDIEDYYRQAIGLDLSARDGVKAALLKGCHGDFRVMVNQAQHLIQVMNTNGLSEVTMEVVRGII